MKARRAIVWILSIAFGLAMTWGTITVFGTTFEKFSESNSLIVFISMGGLAFIWLDFVLMTKLLES